MGGGGLRRASAFGVLVVALVALASILPVQPALAAATRTWTGGGADSNWTTAANWGGTAPVAGDSLGFPQVASRKTNTNDFAANTSFAAINLSGSGYTVSGSAIVLTGTLSNTASGGSNIVGLPINGAGGVSVSSGTLVLQGTNGYLGATTVSGGTLAAANDSALGAAASGTAIQVGASLVLTGTTNTGMEPIALSGDGVDDMGALQSVGVENSAGKVTLNAEAAISVLGILHLPNGLDDAPGAVLNKIGPGDLMFEGNGTFGGQINVYGGTLSAEATMPNPVDIFQTAQVRGDGAVGSIFSAVGTVRPGTGGPGKLTVTGDATFDSVSRLVFDIDGVTPVAQYDQLMVIGGLNLGGARLAIDLGYDPAVGDTFIIIPNAGFDSVTGAFDALPEGATFIIDGVIFKISYHWPSVNGNDVAIVVTGFVTADLSAQVAAAPSPVGAGGLLTFTATMLNAGPQDAGNVRMTFGTPEKTTFESVSAPVGWLCTKPAVGGTGNVSCTRSALANGGVATFTIVVKVGASATGNVVGVAAVTGSTNDPATANNSASVTVPIGAPDPRPYKLFVAMVAGGG
jgi:autotransporter-associated beta strand protein